MRCQKTKFILSKKVTYLNCAYMSPMLKKVEKAGVKGIKQKRKPYHITPVDFFKTSDLVKKYTNREYILLFPFCSPKLKNKNWPYYKELIQKLKQEFKNKN